MNSVSLSGRICSRATITYTQTGTARARFILEVPRARAPSTKDYIPVIAWGTDAEIIRDFTRIDSRVEIRGAVQTYKRKDGAWDINIVADFIDLPDRVERKIEQPKEDKNGKGAGDFCSA